MRTAFFTTIFLFFTLSIFGQTKKDRQAVQSQIHAFITDWNQHNFSNMKRYTTDDVEWVNIVGMWWKGRKEVQYAHEAFHRTMFKDVPLELKATDIRFLTPDVAIARITTHYGEFTTPGGSKMGNTDDLAMLIYVKRKEKWLLTAGENVTVNQEATEHDPVKEMNNK